MNAVLAGESGEAKIRDDEPLRRPRPVAFVVVVSGGRVAGRPRGHDIDAGFELASRLHDRERGRDFGIKLWVDIERAGPNFLTVGLDQLLDPVGRKLTQKIVGVNHRQKIAVANPDDVHGDFPRVDGDDGNAFLPRAGQHIILAGEMHEGRAVADIDVIVRLSQQRFVDN